ncbi:MAG: AAA family ATPase [Lachnospiraceae bacterium]|nr:AAA family ATPase [Lachnospiraceae bacterium]
MGNYLNIGNAGFKAVKKGNYIDKSGLISYVNSTLGTMNKLTCVSRPRRFGKSYAAKMLCAYYDKSCESRELFADLEISKDLEFETYLNKYDVIYLDMTWFISNSASNVKNIVANMQQEVIKELHASYPEAEMGETLPKMLTNVTEATKNKFIIIIDEWDALFRETKNDTDLQKEYIQLMRSLFKSSLTDKMIEGAYITGILPIKKYGTQSALTDFEEYTMLQPEPLEEYVGFTENEVRNLCAKSKICFSEIQNWYDGYILGNDIHIYSPKSVLDAIKRNRLGSYWTQTETYESLKIYIDMDEDGLKETIVQMLGGASCSVDVGTFQNDMTNIQCKDDVLTLLVHLGYLAYNANDKTVFIPNEEVRQEFVRAVMKGKHKEVAKLIRTSDKLLEETLNMNNEAVAAAIEEAHSAGTAPLFYNNEQALRSVIKFAYISCIDEYLRMEELPTGTGYADVVYLPKQGSDMPILLIELKWNKTKEGAISQIKNKNYPQVLEGFGNEILLVGITYNEKSKKHTCVIEKQML